MKEKYVDIGILTFQCSNNYGAMLQAYALKTHLCNKHRKAELVPYDPPYMTGRHWWVPYVPFRITKSVKWSIINTLGGFALHMKMGKDFSMQRANMKRFRKKYLIGKRQRRVLYGNGLKRLLYRYYIVGSDQIWNPDITGGLRKAYFGAFESRNKEKVIAYAASLGGKDLAPQYDRKFRELIQHIEAISVREEAAIPYVKRFYEGDVVAVLDPVFFLDRESWKKVEKIPKKRGYIFVYITEGNQQLVDYARKLSRETGLPVIEARTGGVGTNAGFTVDFTAGPSEFLGYVHKADYVVTNSFHATAFSIIYQKKFVVFTHSNRGARLENIIKVHGLENRLCRNGEDADIDINIDWDVVKEKTKEATRRSNDFLMKHIPESDESREY